MSAVERETRTVPDLYTEVGSFETDQDWEFPSFTTEEIPPTVERVHGARWSIKHDEVGALAHGVRDYLGKTHRKRLWYDVGSVQVLITTEFRQEGYSEVTIDFDWYPVILTVPSWEWQVRFESLAEFFRALAGAAE